MRHLSIHGLFPKPWFMHSCSGLNLNRGLHNDVLRKWFTQDAVHKNRVMHLNDVLHKNHIFPRPVQALFAACRIAFSTVAGGTRRRRLNWVNGTMQCMPQKEGMNSNELSTSSFNILTAVAVVFGARNAWIYRHQNRLQILELTLQIRYFH